MQSGLRRHIHNFTQPHSRGAIRLALVPLPAAPARLLPPRYRPQPRNPPSLVLTMLPVCAVPPRRASAFQNHLMHAFPQHTSTSDVLQMSSESSSFSAGGGAAAAVPRTSGNSAPSPAGAPCPPQLSLEAIASFPPELPPLDDSRMAPSVSSSAAALRARFTTASSDAQALMLSMREAWATWNLFPILPSGTRAVCGLPGPQLPRCHDVAQSLTPPALPPQQLSQRATPCQAAPALPPPHRPFLPTKLK